MNSNGVLKLKIKLGELFNELRVSYFDLQKYSSCQNTPLQCIIIVPYLGTNVISKFKDLVVI